MTEPTTQEEYEEKYKNNVKHFGFGLDTGMELPCPFCAEPGFVSYKILEVQTVMAVEHVCKHCQRGSKVLYEPAKGGGYLMEIVQTSGEPTTDPWLKGMRYVKS